MVLRDSHSSRTGFDGTDATAGAVRDSFSSRTGKDGTDGMGAKAGRVDDLESLGLLLQPVVDPNGFIFTLLIKDLVLLDTNAFVELSLLIGPFL